MAFVPGSAPPSRRSAGGEMLDQPPSAPTDQAGATAGLMGQPLTPPGAPSGPEYGMASLTGSAPPAGPDMLQGFVVLAQEIDQKLLALAQAAPLAGAKLGQARTLVQQAMAELVNTSLLAPSPTGSGFMGGFGSAR